METAIDLFAGAGGFSEGAEQANIMVVWTGNHNPIAVEYHKLNHPKALHVCQDLHQADWRAIPKHDVLLASPCCQGHSPARGKDRPHHDTQRSTAWAVVSCAEYHNEPVVVVENVPEFIRWKLYPAWLQAMNSLGYAIAPHLIDAADHGVPQHRERLFLICTKSKHPMELKMPRRPHTPVSKVIEWDSHDWTSIAKPGRSAATLRRIAAGRARYGDRFVAPYYGSGSGTTGRSVDRPLGTLTTRDRWAIIDGDKMRMVQLSEARAVMGFRPDYKLPANKRDGMQLLGNAVSPVVVTDIMNAIRTTV